MYWHQQSVDTLRLFPRLPLLSIPCPCCCTRAGKSRHPHRLLFDSKTHPFSKLATRHLALHGLGADVVAIGFLHLADGHTATALGEDGEPSNGNCDGDFLVAWNGSRDNSLAELALQVQHAASIILAARSAASARKAFDEREPIMSENGEERHHKAPLSKYSQGAEGLQQNCKFKQQMPAFPEHPRQSASWYQEEVRNGEII